MHKGEIIPPIRAGVSPLLFITIQTAFLTEAQVSDSLFISYFH